MKPLRTCLPSFIDLRLLVTNCVIGIALTAFILGGRTAQAETESVQGFEGFITNTIIYDQYYQNFGVVFLGSPFVRDDSTCFCVTSSRPKYICTGNCNSEFSINFVTPVKNFSFWMVGCQNYGVVAKVDIYENGIFSKTLSLLGANSYYPGFFDLSAHGTKITRVRFYAITDTDGLGWDDFSSTPNPNASPTPTPTPTPTPSPSPTPTPCNLTLTLNSTTSPATNLNNTNQNALIGSLVGLRALVKTSTGQIVDTGSFNWSITGGGKHTRSPVQHIQNFYWLTENGQYNEIRVIYRSDDGTCQLSASVRVKVFTPNQFAFTATQERPYVMQCSVAGYRGTVFGDGCGVDYPGIVFNASLSVAGVTNFISAMDDAKIMFFQLANPYAVGTFPEGPLCYTRRYPANNFDSGWYRDGFEPYYAISYFNPNGTASFSTIDAPFTAVKELYYLYNERFYEMYLVYAAGIADQPRFTKPIAKIPWNWGGQVSFASMGVPSTYTWYPLNQIIHTGVATNSIRPYNHDWIQSQWDTCPPQGDSEPSDENIYVEGVGWGWP